MSHALHQYASEEAAKCGLTKDDVLGRGRSRVVAAARHNVMRRLRADGVTEYHIGFLLDRCHTTVRYALNKPVEALKG